jgi:hypothetical protein
MQHVRLLPAAFAVAFALAACTGNEKGTGLQPSGTGGGSGGDRAAGGGDRGEGGETSTSDGGAGTGDGGASGVTVTATGSTTTTTTSAVTSVTSTVSTGTGGEQVAEVFAHSATTLYRVDLETNDVQTIGDFDGCGADVIDIALDKDSNIYGTTYGGLYRIDRTTAVCTFVAEGDFPNSLSFVPKGTLDPNEEQLVGYVGADYVRIDTETGEVDTIYSDALPFGLESSGDIVSVIDGPTLLTVKGDGCDSADCVVKVDPATGEEIDDLGTATYDNVFGIAFWDGSLYGFTSYGEAFELVPDGNGGFDAVAIPVVGGISFYGAGSTTAAPKGVLN